MAHGSDGWRVRLATPADARALLDIYAPYVRDTCVSFEYEVPSVEAFADRIAGTIAAYPYLVCETGGVPAGYAYASRHQSRSAYDWDVQTSIYLAPEHHGSGKGPALYGCLFALLRAQGFCNAYAVITVPNERSAGFHARAGFVPAGVHHRSGYKFGRWHDVAWMEKSLGGYERAPEPPVPIRGLDAARIERIFAAAAEAMCAG
jgi:phosphinothricin acetyltransferase